MKTVFLRALEADDKATTLRMAIREREMSLGNQRFEVDTESFAAVPRSPFAYWVSDGLRRLFKGLPPFEAEGRTAKQGLATAYDFRFVRGWWEVPSRVIGERWFPFAKGGEFSSFFSDVYLMVNWSGNGSEIKSYIVKRYPYLNGNAGYVAKNTEFYFRPGLTWPRRTQGGLSLREMPAGCIFADKGPAAFVGNDAKLDLLALLAIVNTKSFRALVDLQMAFGSYEVGVIQRTPLPSLTSADQSVLATLARRAWSLKRRIDTINETSHTFTLPALLQAEGDTLAGRGMAWAKNVCVVETELIMIQADIDERCFELYGTNEVDRRAITEGFGTGAEGPGEADADIGRDAKRETEGSPDVAVLAAELVSWAVGVAFGRFYVHLVTGDRPPPDEPEPFDPLPVCSPAMLTGDDGLPLASAPAGYPVDFPENGILVDDPGHPRDLATAVQTVFETVFRDRADAMLREAAVLLDPKGHDLRAWLASDFFEHHLKLYSKSRRKAPIIWQLGVPSGRFSVWLYAHRLARDSFFQIRRDVVEPKLLYEERQLTSLMEDAGIGPSTKQRREIATQEAFIEDLRIMLEEVKRVAPEWNPTLDDGVVLTMAPLWRLVPQHRAWQRELRTRWEELVDGRYDWAQIAMHRWPERVTAKCATDRSLAIAHGLS